MPTYTILEGDTIGSIARRAGVTVEQLQRLNPSLADGIQRRDIGTEVRLGQGADRVRPIGFGDIARSVGVTREELLRMNPHLESAFGDVRNLAGVDLTGWDVFVPTADGGMTSFFRPNNTIRQEWRETDPYGPTGGYNSPRATPGGGGAGQPGLGDIVVPGSDTAGGLPPPAPIVPQGPSPEQIERQNRNALEMAVAAFPWIEQLGLRDQVYQWIAVDGYEGSALLGLIRGTSQWQNMFQGIRRDDGTLRMNEGQYLATMDGYRQTLQRFFGADALEYSNAELSSFLEAELDAAEIGDRLRIYDQVVRGGADLRNAFYVYAGISMSDDQLYEYVVDPFTQQQMDDEYEMRAGVDYETFLARATDIVMDSTGQTIDRETAAQTLDLLYHGGDPGGGDYLSLVELVHAFELAMLGSTATFQGLELPDMEHLQQLRLAGVSRAQALQTYGQYAQDRNFINAIVSRVGGDEFTAEEFTSAELMNTPEASLELRRARQQEAGRSRPGGSFSFGQERGRMVQRGFSAFRS